MVRVNRLTLSLVGVAPVLPRWGWDMELGSVNQRVCRAYTLAFGFDRSSPATHIVFLDFITNELLISNSLVTQVPRVIRRLYITAFGLVHTQIVVV